MIPIICMACKTIWYDIIKIAKNNHINCIVSGGSPIEDSSFKVIRTGKSSIICRIPGLRFPLNW